MSNSTLHLSTAFLCPMLGWWKDRGAGGEGQGVRDDTRYLMDREGVTKDKIRGLKVIASIECGECRKREKDLESGVVRAPQRVRAHKAPIGFSAFHILHEYTRAIVTGSTVNTFGHKKNNGTFLIFLISTT